VAEDFLTFFVMTELQRKGAPALSLSGWQKKQVEVPFAYQLSFISFTEGLAFGAAYMDRFRSMWLRTWEDPDDEVWTTWKAFGLPLDKPPAPVKFAGRCADVQGLVEIIMRHDFPQIELQVPGKKRARPRK